MQSEIKEEITDLDDSWYNEFEITEKDYSNYYKENITYVKLTCIYINKHNFIEKINEEKIFLEKENLLSKENIVAIIKRNNIINNIKYSLLSILKYNIDVDPAYLKTFLKMDTISSQTYLTSIKNIDCIRFNPTIHMFHDLNNLFILFYHDNIPKNITKRVYIKSIHKNKTIRKELKDFS
jgi:hypothetical protein